MHASLVIRGMACVQSGTARNKTAPSRQATSALLIAIFCSHAISDCAVWQVICEAWFQQMFNQPKSKLINSSLF